jgi:hypothetical protein
VENLGVNFQFDYNQMQYMIVFNLRIKLKIEMRIGHPCENRPIGQYCSCSIVFHQHYSAMAMIVFIVEANGVAKKRFVWNYEQQVVSRRGNFWGVI